MMPPDTWHTVRMLRCVERWRDGERAAADELLRALGNRLEHLARKMLRDFPGVRHWAETGDVLQGAVLRLLNALRQVQPASTRDFINLAAVQIRRELLDLARRSVLSISSIYPGADSSTSGPTSEGGVPP